MPLPIESGALTMQPTTDKPVLVVIGAGMAGTRFAVSFAQLNQAYHIILINSEPHAGYNRIMLSPVLAGEKTFADIFLYPESIYAELNIQLLTDCTVTALNPTHKTIELSSEPLNISQTLKYDKLVLATGSTPFILPLPNHQAPGVLAFRSHADVVDMLATVKTCQTRQQNARCVVIGGGLLGLEAANALKNHGADVSVVHVNDYILERQLDRTAAELLQQHFMAKGIQFKLNAQSQAVIVNDAGQVTGLQLKDERILPADCIIMTVGVRPNIALAQASGIDCERGILVDGHMQTSQADVYAIGECIQFEKNLFGLVAPVYEQAQILAQVLDHQTPQFMDNMQSSIENSVLRAKTIPKPFGVKATATRLKVSGVDLFSAGEIQMDFAGDYIYYHDSTQPVYQRLGILNNRLVSAVLYGDVTDGPWFFDLIQQNIDISAIRHQLLFGKAFCQPVLDELAAGSQAVTLHSAVA